MALRKLSRLKLPLPQPNQDAQRIVFKRLVEHGFCGGVNSKSITNKKVSEQRLQQINHTPINIVEADASRKKVGLPKGHYDIVTLLRKKYLGEDGLRWAGCQ